MPEEYLERLYKDARDNRPSDRLSEERRFDLPRYEAFGMLLNRSKDLEEVVKDLVLPDDGETKGKAWSLLGTLQSALLYFEGGRKTSDPPASGFACAIPLEVDPAQPFGFCLGSPVQDITASRYHEVSDLLVRHLWASKVRNHVRGENLEREMRALRNGVAKLTDMTSNDVREVHNFLASAIKSENDGSKNWVVRFAGQKGRLLLTGLWLMYLVSKLSFAKHERKPLDFWFVAGERTEFADDPAVRFDKHPLLIKVRMEAKADEVFNLDKFEPDGNEYKLNDKHCGLIVRCLDKEHYPWFSQGRCSLFFDISTDKLKPSGLAELRLGSWNRLLTESLKLPDEQEINIPACLVAFIDGASGEAGMLVCYPQWRDGNVSHRARVKRILSLKGGKWQCRSNSRQSALRGHFQEHVPWLEKDKDATRMDATTMSEMATVLADDINAGGTLVFLNDKEQFNDFIQLGAPWAFEKLKQDKLPLISHDGATVVWKDGKKIIMAYRQLLTHGNVGDVSDIREILQQKCLSVDDARFPLLGAGTRRWNGALCALRNDVDMVVVISTDGDITCWWGKNGQPRQFGYHHIPVDYHPKTHDGPKDILPVAAEGVRNDVGL